MRDEGKVRLMGVCNFDVEQLKIAEAIRHVDSLQPRLSLIHPEAAADLLPWCAANGTGVIVYSPMGSGLLTERMSAAHLAAMHDDWRLNSADFQPPRLEQRPTTGRQAVFARGSTRIPISCEGQVEDHRG
jgi:aryl-alcohol dehydrogenase-like predicted oxidoreductase